MSRAALLRLVTSFHWWRTVFWLIPTISVYTAAFGTVSVLAGPVMNGRLAHLCARLWSWFILATTGVNVTVRGLERVPRGLPFLFVCNHQSIYDIPVLFWHLPFELRIIAKESLGAVPFIGWHLRRTGHVLVRRDNPGPQVFAQLGAMMKAGTSLIVFPEGTRSPDGEVKGFRTGIFRLAIDSGYVVVPVAMYGTRAVMPKGQLAVSPGEVVLEVFDPIPTIGMATDQARVLADRAQAIVTAGMHRLRQQAAAPPHGAESAGLGA